MALVRRDTTFDGKTECAVSEVIGSILLISVVVIAVAVVGVVLTSQGTPQKIPALSAVISNVGRTVFVYHDGGDTIQHDEMYIMVNGERQDFSKSGDPGWNSWAVGESLDFQVPGTDPINTVTIVYDATGSSAVLASADFGTQLSGTGTATPTPTTPPPTAPDISSIIPDTGVNTTTISITNLAGTNFLAGATVKLNRTGYADISGSSVNVVSPTQITCTFDLTNKIAGQWNVVVTNTDGQSGILSNGFTITMPLAPTVTSIMPNTGIRGTSVNIPNLAGSNFVSGATAKLTRTGDPDIDATGVTVVSSTQITCTFPIPSGATTGLWDVVVTNPDTQFGTLTNGFMVMYPAPTVTSILPVSGNRGWPVSITNLGGSNFLSGATVKLARTGYSDIIATGVTVVSSTQITCTFDLNGAAAGQWNVVVTNPDAQYGTLINGFTVNSPVPVLSTRSPTSGNRGWPVTITSLTGTGFQPGATVLIRRSGYSDVVATGVNVASPTSIDAGTLDLLGVTAGSWYYVVINTDSQESTSTARTFTVNSPAPTVAASPAFSPNTGARGTTGLTITALGTRLQPGMAVVLTRSSTTITAYNVNVDSPTSVTFTIDIPAGATTGLYTARYTNTDGGINTRTNRFTVT